MATKIIYLVRHGAVNYDTENYSLSAEGVQEIERLGQWFLKQHYPVPRVVASSDRPRAVQTAQTLAGALAHKLKLVRANVSPDREAQYGPLDEYGEYNHASREPLDYVIDIAVQECNPPAELDSKTPIARLEWPGRLERIKEFERFIDEISGRHDSTLLVSHANILNMVLQDMFEQFLDLRTFGSSYGTSAISIITNNGDGWRLNKLASVAHKH